jgi:hypothetical protein
VTFATRGRTSTHTWEIKIRSTVSVGNVRGGVWRGFFIKRGEASCFCCIIRSHHLTETPDITTGNLVGEVGGREKAKATVGTDGGHVDKERNIRDTRFNEYGSEVARERLTEGW